MSAPADSPVSLPAFDPDWAEGTRGAQVLLVDDDPAVAQLFALALKRAGFETEALTDPSLALKRLAEKRFDVVVTDLAMTDVSGMDILTETKRRSPSTEVILMTGYGTIELAVESMKRGAADFLTKPFPIKAFIEKVRELAERRFDAGDRDDAGAPARPEASSRDGGRADPRTREGKTGADVAAPADGGAPRAAALSLRSIEKQAVLECLERNHWNLLRTARDLGISRSTLYGKLQRHGLRPPGSGPGGA